MLVRGFLSKTMSLTTSETTTAKASIQDFAGGEVIIPAGSSITSLTFWVAEKDSGTFLAAYDSAGSAVSLTVAASRAYPLPAAIFGAGVFKMVADAAGDVTVCLKS